LASNATHDAPAKPIDVVPGSPRHVQLLQSLAAARAAESEQAATRERDAKRLLSSKTAEAATAAKTLRTTQAKLSKAEASLNEADRRLEQVTSSAASPKAKEQAEASKTKASVRVDELRAELEKARTQERTALEAADKAGEEAKAAAAARLTATQAAEQITRKAQPVSVFVSRKTQRLYVRKSNYPVYEGPVTIKDPQAPIGTFVFTAMGPGRTPGDLRWSVVAMYDDPTRIEPVSTRPLRREASRKISATPSDPVAAKVALDRLSFSKEALDVISEVVLTGSSLIISDEGPSRETGKDTDFVVVMSGEPQGALKIRQREPLARDRDDPYSRSRRRGGDFLFEWD
jgi:hypothetical protein